MIGFQDTQSFIYLIMHVFYFNSQLFVIMKIGSECSDLECHTFLQNRLTVPEIWKFHCMCYCLVEYKVQCAWRWHRFYTNLKSKSRVFKTSSTKKGSSKNHVFRVSNFLYIKVVLYLKSCACFWRKFDRPCMDIVQRIFWISTDKM